MLKILATGPFVPKDVIEIHRKGTYSEDKDKMMQIKSHKKKNKLNINNSKNKKNNKMKINLSFNLKNSRPQKLKKNFKLNNDYINELIKDLNQNNNSVNFNHYLSKEKYNKYNNSKLENPLYMSNYYYQDIQYKPNNIKKNGIKKTRINNRNNFNKYFGGKNNINNISNSKDNNEFLLKKNFNRNNTEKNIRKTYNIMKFPINYSEDFNLNNNYNYNYNNNKKMKKKNKSKSSNCSIDNKLKGEYDFDNNVLKSKIRIHKLSKLLENIRSFGDYDLLINDKIIEKNNLIRSISNLENSIKLFNRNTKDNNMECFQINNDNERLMTIVNKSKDVNKNLDSLKNDNIFYNYNNLYDSIKEETNEINQEIMDKKNEIDEMNVCIKLLNKKILEDNLQCDKIKQDINYYIKHTYNLKERIKLFEQKTENAEYIIKEMRKEHSIQ